MEFLVDRFVSSGVVLFGSTSREVVDLVVTWDFIFSLVLAIFILILAIY